MERMSIWRRYFSPSPYSQAFADTQFSAMLSAPFRRSWCVALILSAGCLPIQEGMQIVPNRSILDLFKAQDNTLFISIWSARAEKGEWTTFFSFSFFFFFWVFIFGETWKCTFFIPLHTSALALNFRERHWLPSGESIQGDFYTYTEGHRLK